MYTFYIHRPTNFLASCPCVQQQKRRRSPPLPAPSAGEDAELRMMRQHFRSMLIEQGG